jgi:rRNA maturation endonuclease Nob1
MVVLTPITSGFNVLVYIGLALTLRKEDKEEAIYYREQISAQSVPSALNAWSGRARLHPAETTQLVCHQCDTVSRPFARYCHRCGHALHDG